jgi:hypothetical protein
MTIVDSQNLCVRREHILHRGGQATNLAGFPEPQRPAVARPAGHRVRQYRDLQPIRLRVREQAAEIVAALGPAALEIIADFRAGRWARITAVKDDPVGRELARARSAEWQRIAASVSMLLILGRAA